jgi:hypothetical protein
MDRPESIAHEGDPIAENVDFMIPINPDRIDGETNRIVTKPTRNIKAEVKSWDLATWPFSRASARRRGVADSVRSS